MRCWWLACVFGCSFQAGGASVPGDGAHDGDPPKDVAMVDTPPDAFDPRCFGASPFYFCLSAVPTNQLTIDGNTTSLSTGTATNTACSTMGGEIATMVTTPPTMVCVFAGTTVTLTNLLEITGSLPAVFAAVDTLTIEGYLDASTANGKLGPAANSPACATSGIDGTSSSEVGAGGAGGGFGSVGGNGAAGGTAAGGTAAPIVTGPVDTFRGGCPGGRGAAGDDQAAAGGSGGGALMLVTRGTLAVSGTVDASGGGGIGGSANNGGAGGGGTGGMIVLDFATLSVSGTPIVFASGGAGGGGAGNSVFGGDGPDASSATSAAPGGAGDPSSGGDGAFGTTPATTPTSASNAGGGGGGGGVGVIRVLSGDALAGVIVSPPPS